MAKTAGDKELKAFASRMANTLQELDETRLDLKQIMAEAREAGLDPKALKKSVQYTMLDPNGREGADEAFDLFAYYVKILTGTETGGRPIKPEPSAAEGATKH